MAAQRIDWIPNVPDAPAAVEEFLPVIIEQDREVGARERVDICSTYEQAIEEASERAARMSRTEPTARAAVLRRRVGPWEVM
jgi:hypothetical protein